MLPGVSASLRVCLKRKGGRSESVGMCVRVSVFVLLLGFWFSPKMKHCIEEEIILSRGFDVTRTPTTKGKTLLMLLSQKKKK